MTNNYNGLNYFVQKKVAVEKDGLKKEITFRKILLNKCQKEFEREKSVEIKRIHKKLEDISSKGLSVSCSIKDVTVLIFYLTTCYYLHETLGLSCKSKAIEMFGYYVRNKINCVGKLVIN